MVEYSAVCDSDPVAYREYLRAIVCERLYNGDDSVDVRAAGGVFDLRVGSERQSAIGWVFGGIRSDAGENLEQGGGTCGRSPSAESVPDEDGDAGADEGQAGVDGAAGECSSGVAGVAARECDDVGRSEVSSGGGSFVRTGGVVPRSKNAEKRARRRARDAAAKAGAAACVRVPEWRRKQGGVGFHKGVFSECSDETQLALRESRAKMLIAKNEAAVIEAQERARRTAAMLKSRVIEENVEKERLELEKKMKVLRESAAMPQGYCETVLSALATPTLSDGTISPDSSISSAEVHKKDEAIKMLVNQCDEQRKESDKTKLALQEMSRKLEEFRLSSERARKEKEDFIRERVRKEREDMFAGRRGDGVKAAYESGKREYSGDNGTKIFWNTNADV